MFLNGHRNIDPIPQIELLPACAARERRPERIFFRAFAADSDTRHSPPKTLVFSDEASPRLGGTHNPEANVFGEAPADDPTPPRVI